MKVTGMLVVWLRQHLLSCRAPKLGQYCCRNWGQQLPKPQVLRSISQMGAEKYRELGVSPMLEMSL
jgi:hypothetical protein